MASKYTCSKKAKSSCLYEVAAEIVSFLKLACFQLLGGKYFTLRSVLSLNNPQNSEYSSKQTCPYLVATHQLYGKKYVSLD
jgi:hypothetical protein